MLAKAQCCEHHRDAAFLMLLCRHQGAVCQGRGAGRIPRGTAARPERHPAAPVNRPVSTPLETPLERALLACAARHIRHAAAQQIVTAEPGLTGASGGPERACAVVRLHSPPAADPAAALYTTPCSERQLHADASHAGAGSNFEGTDRKFGDSGHSIASEFRGSGWAWLKAVSQCCQAISGKSAAPRWRAPSEST